MNCCWRILVKIGSKTATGIFRTPLSACRVLVPSTDKRRRNRSVTSPGLSPRPSRSRGTGGTNSHCSSPRSDISTLESIGRTDPKVYARVGAARRHAFVRALTLFVSLMAVLAPPALFGATSEAARIYEQGRKAERSGHMASAYLLYSQAAALEPTNQLYWLKSLA